MFLNYDFCGTLETVSFKRIITPSLTASKSTQHDSELRFGTGSMFPTLGELYYF